MVSPCACFQNIQIGYQCFVGSCPDDDLELHHSVGNSQSGNEAEISNPEYSSVG